MKTKRALITGITGQDGSYLAELLLEKGYSVAGITSGKSNRENVRDIEDRVEWIVGDVTEEAFVRDVLQKCAPDEVYNLASVATVVEPWKDVPELSRVVALTPLYFLESIATIKSDTRFFQASSSEMYGAALESPQNEHTPFLPRNPYGIAKTFAHSMVEGYRRSHSLYSVSGILFTHESPRRGQAFVTRKISLSLASIKLGMQETLSLGNLDAKRDWGFAGDYAKAMHAMLQQHKADDYVIGTGVSHSVRDFVEAAAQVLDISITWKGEGFDEVGVDKSGKVIISVNKDFYRPVEAHALCGDATKAHRELGWIPEVSFEDLVSMMTRTDLENLKKSL